MNIAQKIKELTKNNSHTEATIMAAEYVGDMFAVEKLNQIKYRSARQNYTSHEDIAERSRLWNQFKPHLASL